MARNIAKEATRVMDASPFLYYQVNCESKLIMLMHLLAIYSCDYGPTAYCSTWMRSPGMQKILVKEKAQPRPLGTSAFMTPKREGVTSDYIILQLILSSEEQDSIRIRK
jgi:hypothetical protein